MRITHPSAMPAVQASPTMKAVGGGGGAVAFSLPGGALSAALMTQAGPMTPQAMPAQSAQMLGGVAGLIALQGVGGQTSPRKAAAMKAGSGVLDRLEALKAEMLSGRITPAMRQALMESLIALDGAEADADTSAELEPGLKDVLAEIRLRAEVELAKLARRVSNPAH